MRMCLYHAAEVLWSSKSVGLQQRHREVGTSHSRSVGSADMLHRTEQ